MHWLERTELLLGEDKLKKLQNAHVLVVGLGGVGAYAAEQLCRAGIGTMTIVDGDVVVETNRNRQLPALLSTTGKPKADILAERFKDINPNIQLSVINDYLHGEEIKELLNSVQFDYVVDAIDTLTPKIFLIQSAVEINLPIISSMGAGGKMDPSKIMISDISKSYNCKLARMLRKRLGKHGIRKGIKVVFSSELIDERAVRLEEGKNKKSTVGTISYMPPTFGCFLASQVVGDIVAK